MGIGFRASWLALGDACSHLGGKNRIGWSERAVRSGTNVSFIKTTPSCATHTSPHLPYFTSHSLTNPTFIMKCFQILALLLTIGSCALITADSGPLRASSEVDAPGADNSVEEFALLDQNEKSRALGGYTEEEDTEDEDDYVEMDKDKGYGMGKGTSIWGNKSGYCDRCQSQSLGTSSYSHSPLFRTSRSGGKGSKGKGSKGKGKGGKGSKGKGGKGSKGKGGKGSKGKGGKGSKGKGGKGGDDYGKGGKGSKGKGGKGKGK
jgi:hypothetical protein